MALEKEVLIVLIAGAGGSVFTLVSKMVYDYWNSPKTKSEPTRLSTSKSCALHESVNKDILSLESADKDIQNCLHTLKTNVHGIELVTTQHEEQIKSMDKRQEMFERSVENLHNETRQIKQSQTDIHRDISAILKKVE